MRIKIVTLIATAAAAAVLSGTPLPAGEETGRWWNVYFTSPGNAEKSKSGGNPEAALCRILKRAEKSFYGAFYSIAAPRIVDAILEAHARGIDVRLVTEKNNARGPQLRRLTDAGIPVILDTNRALMHNKFAVIDGSIVWTGSYNLSENGAMKDNNNAIEINSQELAEIYLHEFNEMFEYGIFGNRKESGIFPALTHKYYVKIGDTPINAYFSPDNDVERILLSRLKKARKSVHFMAFSFTSDPMGEEIIRLHKKGITVMGLLEKSGSGGRDSEYIKMKLEGIPVKLDKNRDLMHHKVIIIDESIVVTGSYNFSKGASRRNDENVLIIENRELAAEYLREFHRLYD